MNCKARVVKESTQQSGENEYFTCACTDLSEKPLLQYFDYTLSQAELSLKGTLQGKEVMVQWDTIRSIYAGRPQVSGSIELVKK